MRDVIKLPQPTPTYRSPVLQQIISLVCLDLSTRLSGLEEFYRKLRNLTGESLFSLLDLKKEVMKSDSEDSAQREWECGSSAMEIRLFIENTMSIGNALKEEREYDMCVCDRNLSISPL